MPDTESNLLDDAIGNTHAESNVLVSSTPCHISPGNITISSPCVYFATACMLIDGHIGLSTRRQFCDLIICPYERGVVNYVQDRYIVRHEIRSALNPVPIINLPFFIDTLDTLTLSDVDHTLYTAGNMDGEVHISLHPMHSSLEPIWEVNTTLDTSIDNVTKSIILASHIVGSEEPRLVVNNHNKSVTFYDIPLRTTPEALVKCGTLKLDYPVNHCSVSPDGRTLLSVGYSRELKLHALSCRGAGAPITFEPMSTLYFLSHYTSPCFGGRDYTGLFSSAFSSDGTKFAVSSQEGTVMVWDIRSSLPLKVIQTDKTRDTESPPWVSNGIWSTRTLKFGGRAGREVMVFNEHTSLMHVVDAQTFETEEIVRVPDFSTADDEGLGGPTDLDLAGLCFDPTGEYLYTGSTSSIVEWKLM